MNLTEFKQRALEAFGQNMEHATPANVREFLDIVARERWREEKAELKAIHGDAGAPPFELPFEKATSYEEILRKFFSDALQAPNEQALIQLWLLALDLSYTALEEHTSDQIGTLFAED